MRVAKGSRIRKNTQILDWLCDHFLPHERNGHYPHFFRTGSLVAIAIGVLLLEGLFLGAIRFVNTGTNYLAAVLPGVLVSLANEDRERNGFAPVEEDPALSAAAQTKAEDMAAKGYFSHTTPDGKDPWYWFKLAGYRYEHAGENLAVNFTDSEDVEEAWMASPTHRANLLKPVYTKMGIGIAKGTYEGKRATFVVQFFATPPAEPPVSTNKPAVEPVLDPVQVPEPSRVHEGTIAKTDGGEADMRGEGSAVLSSESPEPVPSSPAKEAQGVWEKFLTALTSPSRLVSSLLIGLLALTLGALLLGVLIRLRVPHPGMLMGGAALTVLFIAALYLNASLIAPVLLPINETAAAASFSR